MKLTDNAERILRSRYLIKDAKGRPKETPEQLFDRVARAVASAERSFGGKPPVWQKRFKTLMQSLRFLPNSPTLMNAGKDHGQVAACFVLPVEDSMHGIFETLKNAALILQSGGGTGFSFSKLRPSTDPVSSTGGIASGPVSFMRIYNTATDVIKQGGARRGANMGVLRIDHPDILDFINSKRTGPELENFNISVAVTDAFMSAVKKNAYYHLINPRTGKKMVRIRARKVFDALVRSAWMSGDPGVIFIDRINASNPTPRLGRIECTNPCGEQPLLPYEACVLGSINLSLFTNGRTVDYEGLAETVRLAVRFLDDCIEINAYPLDQIEMMHKGNRKIGIGVMGWADMLVDMRMPYDSAEALELAEQVMGFIRRTALEASCALAEERGAFPNIKGSIYDRKGSCKPRNATLTTIAPTGTLSIIAGCSSGIEPLFALANRRRILDDELIEINERFFDISRKEGFHSDALARHVLKSGSLRGAKGVPSLIKRVFKTAHEIRPEAHIRMQAAFQRHTDNAVSKTVNLPNGAKPSDVARALMLAYDLGVKGITVFRYGTKKGGTLFYNVSTKNEGGRTTE